MLLDAARNGVDVAPRRITQALVLLGDLAPHREGCIGQRELRSQDSEMGALDELRGPLQ